MEFGFIVLHYKEIDATRECVASIARLSRCDGPNVRIVVVDNGSGNGSGERLRELYRDDSSVDVVISDKNLGFARGNNFGADFYIETYGCPDYLIACNNDTVIEDVSFLDKVDALHEAQGFNVLGPDVYKPRTHEHQSPCGGGVVTLTAVDGMIADCSRQLEKYRSPRPLEKLYFWIKDSAAFRACAAVKHKIGIFETRRKWDEEQEGVVLQGSFLIFDRAYLEGMPWLFSPATFMYFEENFLHLCAMQNGLKLLYSPKVQILHLHGVSTTADRRKWSQRQLFYYENMMNSLTEYRKLFESEVQR